MEKSNHNYQNLQTTVTQLSVIVGQVKDEYHIKLSRKLHNGGATIHVILPFLINHQLIANVNKRALFQPVFCPTPNENGSIVLT